MYLISPLPASPLGDFTLLFVDNENNHNHSLDGLWSERDAHQAWNAERVYVSVSACVSFATWEGFFLVFPHCDEQFPGATMALTRAHLLHSNCFYCEQRPFVPEHSLRCGWDGNVTSRELWAQSDANVRASYVVDPVRPDWKTSTWGAKLIVLMSFSALLTGCFCPSRRLASCPGWLCRQRRWTITPNGLMYIIR